MRGVGRVLAVIAGGAVVVTCLVGVAVRTHASEAAYYGTGWLMLVGLATAYLDSRRRGRPFGDTLRGGRRPHEPVAPAPLRDR